MELASDQYPFHQLPSLLIEVAVDSLERARPIALFFVVLLLPNPVGTGEVNHGGREDIPN